MKRRNQHPIKFDSIRYELKEHRTKCPFLTHSFFRYFISTFCGSYVGEKHVSIRISAACKCTKWFCHNIMIHSLTPLEILHRKYRIFYICVCVCVCVWVGVNSFHFDSMIIIVVGAHYYIIVITPASARFTYRISTIYACTYV